MIAVEPQGALLSTLPSGATRSAAAELRQAVRPAELRTDRPGWEVMPNGYAHLITAGRRRSLPGGRWELRRSGLSTAHIRAQEVRPGALWWEGASLLRVTKGGEVDQVGGGRRRKIQRFSLQSRKRLLRLVATIRRDAALPLFVTLTYPERFPTALESKSHLRALEWRLRRAFPGAGFIWKLEPQLRGAPHYHILLWGIAEDRARAWFPSAWYEVAGAGDIKHKLWHEGQLGNGNVHCVQQVYNFEGVSRYAAKYLGKTFDVAGWDWSGRFWGVINRQHIPFGEPVGQELTHAEAVQIIRYQRRHAHIRLGGGQRSLTTFCAADHWAEKLRLQGVPIAELESLSERRRDDDSSLRCDSHPRIV